jgi:hypothetical protein
MNCLEAKKRYRSTNYKLKLVVFFICLLSLISCCSVSENKVNSLKILHNLIVEFNENSIDSAFLVKVYLSDNNLYTDENGRIYPHIRMNLLKINNSSDTGFVNLKYADVIIDTSYIFSVTFPDPYSSGDLTISKDINSKNIRNNLLPSQVF